MPAKRSSPRGIAQVAVNVRNVPTTLRTQFKAYCAQHNYTMEEAIKALMYRASTDNWVLAKDVQRFRKHTPIG